jgi:hypothetical protein
VRWLGKQVWRHGGGYGIGLTVPIFQTEIYATSAVETIKAGINTTAF